MNKAFLRFVACVVSLVMTQAAVADDFGTWLSVGAETSLGKNWSVGAEAEWRSAERLGIDVSVAYKPAKWLKLQGGYVLQDVRTEGGLTSTGNYYNSTNWHVRHRFYGDVTGMLKLGRWKLSLRERLTYTTTPSYERNRMCVNAELPNYGIIDTKTVDSKQKTVLRTRLAAEYDIRKCALTPYASVEMYNDMSLQKVRYTIGAEYKINKSNALKMYYLFQNRVTKDDDEPAVDQHVIGASWNIKF